MPKGYLYILPALETQAQACRMAYRVATKAYGGKLAILHCAAYTIFSLRHQVRSVQTDFVLRTFTVLGVGPVYALHWNMWLCAFTWISRSGFAISKVKNMVSSVKGTLYPPHDGF